MRLFIVAVVVLTFLATASGQNDPNNNCDLKVTYKHSIWSGYSQTAYYCSGSCSATQACKLDTDSTLTNKWCAGCGVDDAKPGCCALVAIIEVKLGQETLKGFNTIGGCAKADCPVAPPCSTFTQSFGPKRYATTAGCKGTGGTLPK